MEETPNLALPYLSPSQAQKHVTHNEALRALDALVQLSVRDRDVPAPPPAPAEGDRYLIAASPTGAFAGKAGQIAAWQDGTWAFYPPREGWLVLVQNGKALLAYMNGAWTPLSGPNAVAELAKLGVNTTPTGSNRLAVKTDAVLFSHDDVTPGSGDLRLALNKKAGRIASILFQSDYQTRAELALSDSNRLALRTSADGVAFQDALSIDPATGTVALAVKATTAARAYLIDPVRLGVASSGHIGALAGDAQKTWTGTANTASRDLVISGGAAFADLGTHPFLCVEDYGPGSPRRFNVGLGVTAGSSTLHLANPPAQSGAVTIHGAHQPSNAQHLIAMGQEAWADLIYDADLTRGIVDETFHSVFETDILSTTPWVGTTAAPEGEYWLPFGGLPANQLSYGAIRNNNIAYSASKSVLVAERNISTLGTIQATGQGAELRLRPRGVTGRIVFTVGLENTTATVRPRGQVVAIVDGVTRPAQSFGLTVTEIIVDVERAQDVRLQVTCTDMAGASAGQVLLRIGRLHLLNTQGRPSARAILPAGKTVLIGDSWMDESAANAGNAGQFAPRLRTRLAAQGRGGTIQMRALGGMTSAYGRGIIDWVLANDRPDAVVMSFGINDINCIGSPGTFGAPNYTHPDGTVRTNGNMVTSWDQYWTNVRECREACLRAGVQFVFLIPGVTGSASQTQALVLQMRDHRNPTLLREDRFRATDHELNRLNGPINVRGAFPGRRVYNVTQSRFVSKIGWDANAVWVDHTGATVNTPV